MTSEKRRHAGEGRHDVAGVAGSYLLNQSGASGMVQRNPARLDNPHESPLYGADPANEVVVSVASAAWAAPVAASAAHSVDTTLSYDIAGR